MPLINRAKVFEKINRDDLDAGNTDVSASFIAGGWKKLTTMFKTATPLLDQDSQQLLERVCESCGLNVEQQLGLQARFIAHVGRDSKYHSKTALLGSLKWILKQLSLRVVDPDTVRALSEKINEGAEGCTEGFHNRITQIVLSLRKNDSFNGFLEQFRIEIVEKIARSRTDEVHAHNYFYLRAKDEYAVPALNEQDRYLGLVSNHEIDVLLRTGFSEQYQFWGIFNSLHGQMRTVLTNGTAYEGQKLAGYTNGDYEQILIVLSRYLSGDDIVRTDWLLMNDDDVVVDLNWPIVMYQVWQKFTKEKYFLYSWSESVLFDQLFNPEISAEELDTFLHNNAAQLSQDNLFTNETQLKMYVNDSVWFPHDKRLVFFAHYIAKIQRQISPERFLPMVPLFMDVGYHGQGIPKWVQHQLTYLLKKQGPYGDIPLEAAMRNNTRVVPAVFKLIQTLSYIDQMEIYGHVRPIKKIDLQHAEPILKHAVLEAEISLLLIELKDKIPYYQRLENSEPGRYQDVLNAVSTLHGALLVGFNTYWQSEKNQQAILELQTHCSTAINQSKQTILDEYPDVMAIVAQVFLFLTGVGAIYLLYQAQNNYANNRSLFFPSATETKINEVEDTLNIISEVHAMR